MMDVDSSIRVEVINGHDNDLSLKALTYHGVIDGPIGKFSLQQHFTNLSSRPKEIVYTFPLNSNMLIDEFHLLLNGQSLQSKVLPLEEAQKQYDDAVIRGDSAVYVQQYRSNVFTLNIGNLAPTDDLIVQIKLLQLLTIAGQNIRIMLPTVIGPRYIPGHPLGERDGFGWADPTDQVPDADWITPPISEDGVPYSVNVRLDITKNLPIESITSPSHQIHFYPVDEGFRVISNANSIADRDFVLNLNLKNLPTNRFWQTDFEDRHIMLGWLGIGKTESRKHVPTDYFFLLDRSGSMADFKFETVKRAVRLCFRKLTTEDRFNLGLFNHQFEFWQNHWENVSEHTVNQAETWLKTVVADGGTELLPALRKFFSLKIDPKRKVVLILLTDGQVGNEAEITDLFEDGPQNLTVLLFGIDTAVNQELFESIIEKTTGMVEYIYPGEPMEHKIMLQFERLEQPIIRKVQVNGKESIFYPSSNLLLHPDDLRPVILTIDAKSEKAILPVSVQVSDGQTFGLNAEVISCNEEMDRVLKKFFAHFFIKKEQSRLNELAVQLNKRNEKRLKEKILNLALKYQLQTPFTAWFVLAKRKQKIDGLPVLQVVPTALPHTWQQKFFSIKFKLNRNFSKVQNHLRPIVSESVDFSKNSEIRSNKKKEIGVDYTLNASKKVTFSNSPQNRDLIQELWLAQSVEDGAIQPEGLENETPAKATLLTLLALVNMVDGSPTKVQVYLSNFLKAILYLLTHTYALSAMDKIIFKYVLERVLQSGTHLSRELITEIDKMVKKVTENPDRFFYKLKKIHLKANTPKDWQVFKKLVNKAVSEMAFS